jgi:uncharacterized membrane protein
VRRPLQIFATGLLAALPLAATVAIFVWGARLLYGWLGPTSLLGQGLISIGLSAGGSEVAGYAIGVAIVMAAIFGLGLLVESRLRGVIAGLTQGVIQRIPLVRNVYDLAKKFVDLVSQRPENGVRSMSAVWLRFGAPDDEAAVAVLGLLSSPEPVAIDGREYLAVLVPTAPVPVGGGLLYVPREWVRPANIGVEALTSIYVSMGITSPQYLGARSAGAEGSPPVR